MNATNHFWRYSLVAALFCAAPLFIAVQLVRVRIDPNQAAKILADGEVTNKETRLVVPPRGQLYDRWGNLLAGNRMVYEVGVSLYDVRNPETIAKTLEAVLDVDYGDALARASLEPSPDAIYSLITDYVSPDDVAKLQILVEEMEKSYSQSRSDKPASLRGLMFTPHLARIYPEKTLASNLLGFVNRDNQGVFGVEQRFNDLIAGKPRTVVEPLDPYRVEEIPDVPAGASLVLTIDRQIQQAMEDLIDRAVDENGAVSGTIVVVAPHTGDVLAMATTPRIDLNEYYRYKEVFPGETPFNRAVSQAYEPGSVFKVLTMASALDIGAVKPETVFVDTGSIEVGGAYIINWNQGAWGPQDMTGCMRHSLNVCLAWIATQIGPNDFYRYMSNFGIGSLTGVDLAGENSGRLKVPGDNDWYAADLGTNSFGQGVSTTPLQMAAAVSAVANGGVMMAPSVVRSVIDDGYQHNIERRIRGMPIRPETARTLSEMLAVSLEEESSDALVTGYRVAGKTGTAEIATQDGYTSNVTNASFVGWGPVDDPQFLVYVWLEKPVSSPWGSVVAAPVFRQAVEQLVLLLNLPPDDVRRKMGN
ncbi:MAG: peptidoglycan D,D-transpeptidase FtsI family protein [Chloroflexota bacterium]